MKYAKTKIADAKMGICPKCGRYRILEYGHVKYQPDNDIVDENNGRLICHECNLKEIGVSPEVSNAERVRIRARDYGRRNRETTEERMNWEGEKLHGAFRLRTATNHRTGHVSYSGDIVIRGLFGMEDILGGEKNGI